jgi:hypothetical protein
MSMATFSGPVRSGTVRYGTSATENTGLVTLSRTAYVNMNGVAVTSGTPPVAQTLFTLPAGSKILNFIPEVLVVVAGNSISQVGVTIGKSGSAAEFAASFNTGIVVARVTQATVDAALTGKVVALDNIGTADVPITATFTATTGNATSGQIAITVVYQQRNADGSQAPAYNQN